MGKQKKTSANLIAKTHDENSESAMENEKSGAKTTLVQK
jgi:hypothetical protein